MENLFVKVASLTRALDLSRPITIVLVRGYDDDDDDDDEDDDDDDDNGDGNNHDHSALFPQ